MTSPTPPDAVAPAATPAPVLVVTGAMASGKSTVAEALARTFPLAAHVRGDLFRRFVVSGQASMEPPLSPAARAQLDLRQRLAAQAADTYAMAGVVAVVQDILLGPDLERFTARVRTRPCYAVVLAPDAATLAARDAARHKQAYGEWTPGEFAAAARETPGGLHLDTTRWTVAETVRQVLDRLDEARVA
ncbi:AAA family ATPase [Cellulosimicrobium sp. I38E]|uniref:AAA family ATPase n=1 Tax=Cellulosimicrobium sp. I38E TaxID=1393139 RepID=UPI0007B28D82|nr:AAA family ATPase [Cellulosimicrobium sp. I38E]KZM76228.1 phosphotransferase [Cellulosimicrobium sp. I38E]